MENSSGISREDEQMELPPGFRFHPTDEELISHYLIQKVLNTNFDAIAIGEADLNKVEPWELRRIAKMGEKEWYFFCIRDRKYPTGMRTNRATEAGYWKATGKDKEIHRAKMLVGMKKTLVFYKGRAPKGEKTNWVMHEYRLEGNYSKPNLPKSAEDEWVICRIFDKSSGSKNPDEEGPGSESSEDRRPSIGPSSSNSYSPSSNNPTHVTCFSDQDLVREDTKMITTMTTAATTTTTTGVQTETPIQEDRAMMNPLMDQNMANFQHMNSSFMQDQSMVNFKAEHDGKGSSKIEFSHGMGFTGYDYDDEINNYAAIYGMLDSCDGSIDLDSLLNGL